MNGLIDGADRVYWWLRQRPPVAGAIAAAVVAMVAGLLLLGGDGNGGKRGLPATAVATVGDTPITRSELTHWQSVYVSAATGTAKPSAAEARKAAFELLAGSAWITAEAERQRVSVTATEARKAADTYLTQAATSTKLSRAALLKQLGTTEADVRFQQRVSLLAGRLQEKLIKALPAPTDAAVSRAFTDEPGRWASPTQRDVEAVITATKASASGALTALKGGATFADVNQRYSSNSTLTGAGGKLTGLKPGSTEAAVERPIFAAPVDSLQGPVAVGEAFMVFKVTKSTPLAAQTLAQASKAIRADLGAAAATAATNAFLGELRKRWRPRTRCAATVTSSDYCGASAS